MNTSGSAPSLFRHIAFTVYPVRDVQTARRFYEGTLGLTVSANWDNQWVEYDIGAGTLAITTADAKHQPGAHGPTVGLEVVDFDATLAHLREQAVSVFDGPFDTPSCRGCVIRDPDENELILHARK